MTESHPAQSPEQKALMAALDGLLAPLAQLAVSRGLNFATIEDRLKQALVHAARDAAMQANPAALPHRLVSRISTATGINRREVTRLVSERDAVEPHRPSPALRVAARWASDPHYQTRAGDTLVLPRQGPAPSFEALAALVTRDVHPRSLLDAMLGLKIVSWDTEKDQVRLSTEAFVPSADQIRLVGYLGSNVGDHLRAAVENVNGQQPAHVERAMLATGLSEASLTLVRQLVDDQWRHLMGTLVPALQQRIDADARNDQPEPPGRVRIGLYAYSQDASATAPPPPAKE